MQKSKVIGALIGTLVTLPIWLFLLYTILSAINADRLIWFLFWVYVPACILVKVLNDIASKD